MKPLCLVLVAMFLTLALIAQDSFLHHYSVNDGLPANETYTVFQDSKGYIWIGTDMGACRFNGYSFKTYTTADGLTDNTIFGFFEDAKGRIWFHTFSGRLCYFQNDSISSAVFPVNNQITDFLNSQMLTGIQVDSADTILMASWKGLLKIIPGYKDGKRIWDRMEILSNDLTVLTSCGYLTFKNISANSAKPVMYSHDNRILFEAQPVPYALWRAYQVPNGPVLSFYEDTAMAFDSHGSVGLLRNVTNGIAAYRENDSMIWVGKLPLMQGSISSGGVYLYSKDFSRIYKEFLKGFSVTGILKDRENGYWFSTLESGIYYLPSSYFKYFPLPDNVTLKEIRLGKNIDGSPLLITYNNIIKYDIDNDPVPFLPGLWNQVPNNKIWARNIFTAADGRLWISMDAGIAIVDAKSNQLIRFIDLIHTHGMPKIHDSRLLIQDHLKNIWSLNRHFLTKINSTTYQLVKVVPLPSVAETICEDDNGDILVGTLNGLYRYDGDSLVNLSSLNPIYKNRFVDIKRCSGYIVGATRGAGLYILTPDSVYHVTEANGLLSNMCRSVFTDDENTIWITSNRGLNSLSFTDHPFKTCIRSFTVLDGLPSKDILEVIKQGKTIWLTCASGVCAFNPGEVLINNSPPPIYITSIKTDNVKRSADVADVFSYQTNFIQIEFTGLTFKNPGKQLYAYKLQGYDTGWSYTKNTSVQFTKLPPGNYKFVVKCINNDGVGSEIPAVYNFTISTPFYRQWWFNILLSCLCIVIIAIVATFVTKHILQREKIKNENKRRIADLELKALRAQMNPHFVFNCLSAIKDFILQNDTDAAEHYLVSFSKLLRLAFENSRRSKISLDEEIEFLNLYIELEQMRFDHQFKYKISISDELKRQKAEIPSMILQPFIENAIRHGRIGSLNYAGLLDINFSLIRNTLVCRITDNGIGLKKSGELQQKTKRQQPHALDAIREHLTTVNAMHQSIIEYTMTDLSELSLERTGTLVEIFIPISITADI